LKAKAQLKGRFETLQFQYAPASLGCKHQHTQKYSEKLLLHKGERGRSSKGGGNPNKLKIRHRVHQQKCWV